MKEYRFILAGYTRRSNKGVHILNISLDKPEIDGLNSKDTIGSGPGKREETPYMSLVDSDVRDHSRLLLNIEDPSYMALDADKLFVLSSRDEGGVKAYNFDRNREGLRPIGGVDMLGKAPCHLFFDRDKSLIYASNYHLGRLDILFLNEDGLSLAGSICLEGRGPISPNQDGPRCHMAIKDPSDRFTLVVNLGGDRVETYYIDTEGYDLVSSYHTRPGMGPRHMVFGPGGRHVYLMGELDSTVEVLAYDNAKGTLKSISRVSSLPEGSESFTGNSGAAIKVTKLKNELGKYNLYVSNRGHNSLSVYEIGDGGNLNFLQNIGTGGKNPRDFALSPDDRFILVGHQDSEDIVLFERLGDGRLLEGKKLKSRLDEIVCIIPID